MCAQLAAAQQFSFKAHREMDPALVPGSEVAQVADIEVTVKRPNKAVAEANSKKGLRRLYFDGQTFSLLDAKMNLLRDHPAAHDHRRSTVDQMDTRFGFVPPLAGVCRERSVQGIFARRRTRYPMWDGTHFRKVDS